MYSILSLKYPEEHGQHACLGTHEDLKEYPTSRSGYHNTGDITEDSRVLLDREVSTDDVTWNFHGLPAYQLAPSDQFLRCPFLESLFCPWGYLLATSPSKARDFSLLHYKSSALNGESLLVPWHG